MIENPQILKLNDSLRKRSAMVEEAVKALAMGPMQDVADYFEPDAEGDTCVGLMARYERAARAEADAFRDFRRDLIRRRGRPVLEKEGGEE